MTDAITTIALPGEKETIEWLCKAKSNDPSRHVLDSLCRQGEVVAATDGFRIHFAETPRCMAGLEDTNDHGQANFQLSEAEISWVPEPAKFPELRLAMPEGEPQARFRISPRFLTDALAGFLGNRGVCITVYPDDKITVQGLGDSKRYAVVVDQHKEKDRLETLWMPDLPASTQEEV